VLGLEVVPEMLPDPLVPLAHIDHARALATS